MIDRSRPDDQRERMKRVRHSSLKADKRICTRIAAKQLILLIHAESGKRKVCTGKTLEQTNDAPKVWPPAGTSLPGVRVRQRGSRAPRPNRTCEEIALQKAQDQTSSRTSSARCDRSATLNSACEDGRCRNRTGSLAISNTRPALGDLRLPARARGRFRTLFGQTCRRCDA